MRTKMRAFLTGGKKEAIFGGLCLKEKLKEEFHFKFEIPFCHFLYSTCVRVAKSLDH